ncbi:MAG: insulinase family protein [Rhodobacteraceae bacterium]|jgi:zinc protease|nr:insulinase family protein [Paracoccaceae bacterium]
MIRRFFAMLVVTVLAALPVTAQDVTTFTLENGLEAVVIEDHRAPVVVHMVWYKVGAADEAPGKSGIAHFLEHLMFKGTDTVASGEFSEIVKANGGSDNAFTSYDYTAYFQRVAADRLDLMMKMEADRMRNLHMSQQDVTTERQVILEERNQRTDSDPSALFREQLQAAQYLNHPYGTPVIGWRQEMEGLSHADALAFYRRYYAPNNAILIVGGDVDPEQVRELAEETYGKLAPTPDLAPRIRPQEPPQLAERRLSMQDARIGQPYVIRSYLAPTRRSGDQAQAATLEVLAEVLGGNGATSVLGRKLQFDSNIAVYTTAFYDSISLDPSTFGLMIIPADGVSLTDAEAAMDATIAEFLQNGIDDDQFARIKTRMRAAEIYDRDSMQGQVQRYGSALASGLTIQDVQDWPATLQAVTQDDVIAAGRAVLDRRNAVTGLLSPAAPPDATVIPANAKAAKETNG